MTKKLTYEFVKDYIEREGYILLSHIYINANSKLDVRCSLGHEYSVTYSHFYSGKRCPECNIIKRANKHRHSYDHVKYHIEKEGYKLLSNKYKNTNTRLNIRCPLGHEYHVTYGNFHRGQRCKKCDSLLRSEKRRCSYEHVKENIEKEGYKLLSNYYKNNNTKLEIRCVDGHNYTATYSNFQQGKRCPVCRPQFSKIEKDIVEYITSFIDVIENDRTQIINPFTKRKLELDIWIPELSKAIEFNGKYWHSFDEVQERDEIKKQQCEEKGIELLVIEEQEWIRSKDRCKNNIKEFIEL